MSRPAHPYNDTPRWIPTPALVADVELTGPITPLSLGSNYRAARLLVRVHSCPVGYADLIGAAAEPIDRARILAALDPSATSRALRHLADDLVADGISALPAQTSLAAALDRATNSACIHRQPTDGPLVTVAICTRDRAYSLDATLASLAGQTYRNFEILVVDNAPSDATTAQFVQSYYPNVRYVREDRPGLDWARNRAIAEARTEFVAFIDDDAVADRGWLAALIAAFDSPEVMCVTGLVVPARLATAAQELFERFGFSKAFDRHSFTLHMPTPRPGFPFKGFLGTGCNSAFRRPVFEQIGLFDVHLDVGTPVPGGGDLDMFARIIRAGYKLVYDPAPVVFHDHVADMAVLIEKMGQYQQAAMAYLTKHMLTDRAYAPMLLAQTLRSYLRSTTRGVGAALLKRDRPLRMVLNQAIQAWLGPLALYHSHRRVRASANGDPQQITAPAANARPRHEFRS